MRIYVTLSFCLLYLMLSSCKQSAEQGAPAYSPDTFKHKAKPVPTIKEITILFGPQDTLLVSRTKSRELIANNDLKIHCRPLLMERAYFLESSTIRTVKQMADGLEIVNPQGDKIWRLRISENDLWLEGIDREFTLRLYGKSVIKKNTNGIEGVEGSYIDGKFTLNYFDSKLEFAENVFHPGYAILSCESINKYDRFILFTELLRQVNPVGQ